MKNFLLFAGCSFYPDGGWIDYRGSFDTQDEAIEYAKKLEASVDWWHVVNLLLQSIVAEGKS